MQRFERRLTQEYSIWFCNKYDKTDNQDLISCCPGDLPSCQSPKLSVLSGKKTQKTPFINWQWCFCERQNRVEKKPLFIIIMTHKICKLCACSSIMVILLVMVHYIYIINLSLFLRSLCDHSEFSWHLNEQIVKYWCCLMMLISISVGLDQFILVRISENCTM